MTYDSLDILPIKLFYKIAETGDVSLLSDKKVDHKAIWERLREDFKKYDNSTTERTLKQIERLKLQYQVVTSSVYVLRFDWSQAVVDLLKEQGYSINEETYSEDLDDIERQNESLLVKISYLQAKLPKENKQKVDLDEVMGSFSSILGFDFDYNTISVTKFFALEKQVRFKAKKK